MWSAGFNVGGPFRNVLSFKWCCKEMCIECVLQRLVSVTGAGVVAPYSGTMLPVWSCGAIKMATTSPAVSFVIPVSLKVCRRLSLGQVRGVCSDQGCCPGGKSAHSVLLGHSPFVCWHEVDNVWLHYWFWAAVQGPTLWGSAMIVNSAASLAWNSARFPLPYLTSLSQRNAPLA